MTGVDLPRGNTQEDRRAYSREYYAKNGRKTPQTPEYQRLQYEAHREKRLAAGRARYEKNKEAMKAKMRARYAANPTAVLESGYRSKYGLSLAQVLSLFDAAGDACQCCGAAVLRPPQRAGQQLTGHIDHCHTTGKVRGILCSKCNTALGLLDDRPELAVAYLDKTK